MYSIPTNALTRNFKEETMKKATKILAFLIVIATFVALLSSGISAQFEESIENYDDYGYYVYYDFEAYSSSTHSAYFTLR